MPVFRCIAVLTLAALAGCTLDPPKATEVELSLKYDTVPCADLIARRNALQAKYPNLPPDTGEAALAWGGFTFIGDALARAGHEERVAKGKIEAMTDSIRRRKCEG
jgi:hypothetical protein